MSTDTARPGTDPGADHLVEMLAAAILGAVDAVLADIVRYVKLPAEDLSPAPRPATLAELPRRFPGTQVVRRETRCTS
jgi:hypothetical protein